MSSDRATFSGPLGLVAGRTVCAACRGELLAEANGLACAKCATRFDIVDGIPILVVPDERSRLAGVESKKAAPPRTVVSRLKRALNPPSPSYGIVDGCARIVDEYKPGSAILEVGSGTRRLRRDVINLEIDRFENVDIVANGARLPFLDDTFDLVISQAVLEHVPNPREVVVEMIRVLKPGGRMYVEIPFLQGFHADPHDYQRYTLSGLDVLLAPLRRLDSGVAVGPSSVLAWVLREYFQLWAPRALRAPVAVAGAWLTTPIKYLDRFVANRPDAHRIAAGLYFIGQKE